MNRYFQIAFTALIVFVSDVCWGQESTRVRLSFWVAPERQAEFMDVYAKRILPLVAQYGFVPLSQQGRATPENVFSRLFEVASQTDFLTKRQALEDDNRWRKLLNDLDEIFGEVTPDRASDHPHLMLYSTPEKRKNRRPTGPGKSVLVGPGTGNLKAYEVLDGLAGAKYLPNLIQ